MKPGNSLRHHKWMTIAAVLVLLATTLAGVYAIWGVVFVYWGVLAIRSGQAFLVEAIERRENPVLFWVLTAMWFGFGVLYILTDIFPTQTA